ncbi:Glutamate decarboxylase 2 [Recurvomyces mirabilis]|uniref:Nucleolar protein 9 n=1 Tax=Recurvomyces mirabilis TaxID=574656 RepID=A0AAE0WTD0_9PEZI|nr:Glutamate decarboxylase 2 [Recurvomyces mirabilis]KAK5159323.1 Glutamate decarboxylase 2 [Recurvomyces mirabilis]
MPQENKKRGRRMKRKHEDEDGQPAPDEASKRRKSSEYDGHVNYMPLGGHDESVDAAYPHGDRPFFGMLDMDEQEYFKRADDMLEANSFGEQEERDLFLANVYREAEGKELKIAQSQSCSRLMERLIQLSTPAQMKKLFQAFSGNFIHLISHRFASHCCEALFLRAAPIVSEELVASAPKTTDNVDEIYVSMENLFLHTLAELEGSIGFLMTDQFGSHALRVLLLVLSGDPLDAQANNKLLQSKRKEAITVQGSEQADGQSKSRNVPKSFADALEKLLADSVAGLDTEQLRGLSTHANANPTLQLLLKLELTHFGKQRAKNETSIIRTLLPDDPITADSGSAAFINGLVYDSIGSHLVEQIVQHAPGKMFKSLNKEFFKDRLDSLARNETAGYVACRVLERMSKDDLYEAHEKLIPAIPDLLERNRTLVLRTLVERCAVRDIDTQAIAAQLDATLCDDNGFDVKKLLKLENSPAVNGHNDGTPHDSVQSSGSEPSETVSRPAQSVKVHFNLLAQAMLRVPGPLSGLVLDSLINLTPQLLLQMVKDTIICRTIQAVIASKNSSIIQKRKLVQHFYGSIGDMAVDKSASHVVDSIWNGTHGLAFIRERIAEELAENEAEIRDSQCGRAVWKNWKMDLYKRRRQDWIRQSKEKASNDGFQSFAELDKVKKEGQPPAQAKTPLQLARERHAKKAEDKAAKERSRSSVRTNGNGPAAGSASAASATATASG